MGWKNSSLEREYFRKMPKIELHRHLEGALRFETLVELALNDENIISNLDVFRKTVQICTNDPLTYENFLSKFQPFRKILKSPDVIPRIVFEAVEDAANENILYMELRFTPSALCINGKYGLEDVIKWVTESAQEASKKFGIQMRLILSINRHEPVEIAEKIGKLAVQFQDQGIVAVDLAGDESNFSALPFLPVFAQLKKQGLFITIHAGEWNSAENVLEAIELFNANRIGHGVRVLENTKITELARNCVIPFELCITSNFHSGVVGSLKSHPIKKMLNSDLNITINSDDPGISQITLSDEFYLLRNHYGFSVQQIFDLSRNAISAAFLTENEKKALLKDFEVKFNLWKINNR